MDLFDYSNYESDSFIDSAPPQILGPADPMHSNLYCSRIFREHLIVSKHHLFVSNIRVQSCTIHGNVTKTQLNIVLVIEQHKYVMHWEIHNVCSRTWIYWIPSLNNMGFGQMTFLIQDKCSKKCRGVILEKLNDIY